MCNKRSHKSTLKPRSEGEYDFIIVGGGSAGNVVGARLADRSPDIKVLILESGKNTVDDAEAMAQSMKSKYEFRFG